MNGAQIAYQYGIGGAFLLMTLFLVIRSGAADVKVQSDRQTIWLSLLGLVMWLGIHWAWAAAVSA